MTRYRVFQTFVVAAMLVVFSSAAFAQGASAPSTPYQQKYRFGSEGRQGLLFLLFVADVSPYTGVGAKASIERALKMMSSRKEVGFRNFQPAASSDDVDMVISLVGEVGFSHVSGGNLTTFLAGPRVTKYISPGAKAGIFGQVAAGAVHGGGSTDFAMQPSGGVIVPINPNVLFSGQLDFLIDFYGGGHSNDVRFSVGVAIPFGH